MSCEFEELTAHHRERPEYLVGRHWQSGASLGRPRRTCSSRWHLWSVLATDYSFTIRKLILAVYKCAV